MFELQVRLSSKPLHTRRQDINSMMKKKMKLLLSKSLKDQSNNNHNKKFMKLPRNLSQQFVHNAIADLIGEDVLLQQLRLKQKWLKLILQLKLMRLRKLMQV